MQKSEVREIKKPKKSYTYWGAFCSFYKPILAEVLSAKNMKDVTPKVKMIEEEPTSNNN